MWAADKCKGSTLHMWDRRVPYRIASMNDLSACLASAAQRAFDVLFVDSSRVRAHNAVLDFAVLKQHYCWNAHDFVFRRYFLVGVDVHPDEFYFPFEFI